MPSVVPNIGVGPNSDRSGELRLGESRLGEARFDEIVALAAELCGTSMAAITIVDGDQFCFAAQRTTPSAPFICPIEVCAMALLSRDVLVIEDVSAHAAAGVVGDGARFFASVALIGADGVAVGALSVIDGGARTLEPWQHRMLQVLARQTVAHIQLSRLAEHHAGTLDELNMAQRNLDFMTTHDPLTSLLNRRTVTTMINGLAAGNTSGALKSAVLLIDLDNFQDINDEHGAEAADRVLVTVADRIHLGARGDDAAARLGGDEFVVVIPNAGSLTPEALARRLLESISAPIDFQGEQLTVTASIGVARWSVATNDAGDILRDATAAMHYAKVEGRNRYVTFEQRVAKSLAHRVDTHTFVRNVIRDGLLRLDFQPLWSLSSGAIIAHEALLRWDAISPPDVGPAEFVAAAEELGVVGEITRFAIFHACALAAKRRQAGDRSAAVTVNLSSVQLARDEVILIVASALNDSGLDAAGLILELTESAKLVESGAGQATLRALQDMGVRIALDDFGTGFSSLALLRSFPFDFMKIDRSFVTVATAMDRDVLRSLVQLGHSLGMKVVAEGIEDPEVLAQLRSVGCDVAQGYLLGRPGPPDAAIHVEAHPLIAALGPDDRFATHG
jgi:diguanylate cyclase (GGDEF)-like protein